MTSNRSMRSPATARRAGTSANRLDEVLNIQQAFEPSTSRTASGTRRASTSRLSVAGLSRMEISGSTTAIPAVGRLQTDGNVATPSFRGLSNFGVDVDSVSSSRMHPNISTSLPSASLLSSDQRGSSMNFTPRIVRGADGHSVRQTPSRARSTGIIPRAHHTNSHQTSLAKTPQFAATSRAMNPTLPTSFPRPIYLNNSAFRDLLVSELPPQLPPNRFRYDQIPRESSQGLVFKSSSIQVRPQDSEDEGFDDVFRSQVSSTGTVNPPPSGIHRLPTRWSTSDHSSDLSISEDGTILSFNGPPTSTDKEAAAARTNHHVPSACGIYYYEVEVLNPGVRGHISVGFSSGDVPLNRLPGWEENSWGYHGDDGHVFASEGEGKPYGPTYTSGDTIGCGIDFTLRRMFYTKNGSFLGLVFDKVGTERRLFPSVGLRTPHESVKTNFGQEEFRFDINAYVCQERTRVWRSIQTLSVTLVVNQRTNESGFTGLGGGPFDGSGTISHSVSAPSAETMSKLNEVVLSYLNHCGYSKSYQALKKAINGGSTPTHAATIGEDMDLDTDAEEAAANHSLQEEKEEQDLFRRINILDAVQTGDIDTAMAEIQQHYPGALEAEEGLMKFRLRCRKLVELILESSEKLKKIQSEKPISNGHPISQERTLTGGVFDMEIDVDGVSVLNSGVPTSNGCTTPAGGERAVNMEEYYQAFGKALSFGQALQWDFKDDKREVVAKLFKQSASLMAFADPLEADKETAALVSHESRVELANELNKTILAALGRPVQSTLEKLYLQTCTVTRQLGLLGEGSAAFADARREILES